MKPIHVLHLIGSSEQGGAQRVVEALTMQLDAELTGAKVAVLGPGWLSERLTKAGVPVQCFRKRWTLDFHLLRQLMQHIRRTAPDVVHCHLGAMSLYGCLAARCARVPSIAHIHGVAHDLDRPRRRVMQKLGWLAATRVVAVSAHLERELRRMGAPLPKTIHIHNGVDTERFAPPADAAMLKRKLGIPESRPVIGVVARLEPEKGCDLALATFARVVRRFPAAHLVIGGDGAERPRLEAEARELRLSDRTLFLGQVDDVPSVLGAADAVLVPSRSEGFSLGAVEAMAVGRPVVAWDHEALAEVVVDGETGLLVPPFDVDALAEATSELLADTARATALGLAGRERAQREYSERGMLDKFQALYRELAARKKGAETQCLRSKA